MTVKKPVHMKVSRCAFFFLGIVKTKIETNKNRRQFECSQKFLLNDKDCTKLCPQQSIATSDVSDWIKSWLDFKSSRIPVLSKGSRRVELGV